MNKYIINGVRWFDRIDGNTYHTVNIIQITPKVNKQIFVSIDMVYGYGDQWKDTAYDELIKLKLVKEADRNNHKKNHNRFIYLCSDVTRKRDLFN